MTKIAIVSTGNIALHAAALSLTTSTRVQAVEDEKTSPFDPSGFPITNPYIGLPEWVSPLKREEKHKHRKRVTNFTKPKKKRR